MRRKGLVIGIIILMIGVNIGSSFARDTQPIGSVGFDGNILYVGGTGPNNYTSIQEAINDAEDGYTVFVYGDSSPYYENVIVNKRISLIGENKITTIIDAGSTGDAVFVSDDEVIITGFTLQNSGSNFQTPDVGIEIRSNHNTISGNIIKNNLMGIWLFDASFNIISENIVANNVGEGVCINLYTYGNIIYKNTIIDNGWEGVSALGLYNNYNHNISGNIIVNNGHGIYLAGSLDNYIESNIIENNRYMGIWLIRSENNLISGNSIKDNMLWGISLEYSPNNTISFNNIINNYYPPRFENCHTNEWIENYWDNWIGHKIRIFRFFPKFIFGFDERGIPWINFDWRPAQEPYDI